LVAYSLSVVSRVFSNAVNIPFWDEWELLNPGWIDSNFGSWIWAFHNEHRVVPTHLVFLINKWVFGLDFRAQILMNLAAFLGFVFFCWREAGRFLGKAWDSWTSVSLGWALSPTLSSLFVENHLMAGQNCILFALISYFWGCKLLLGSENPGFLRLMGGAFLWCVSIFSFGSGPPAVMAGWLVFSGRSLGLYRRDKSWMYFRRWATVTAVVVWSLLLWASGYRSIAWHPHPTPFWDPSYWLFLGHLVALGFGYGTGTSAPAVLGVFLLLVAGGLSMWIPAAETENRWARFLKLPWLGLGILAGLTAMLAAVAYGRAGFGLGWAGSGRYAETSSFLPWILWTAILLALQSVGPAGHLRLRRMIQGTGLLLWFFLGIGIPRHFSLRNYSVSGQHRQNQKACAVGLLQPGPDSATAECPDIYPGPIRGRVRRAAELGYSFMK
ncbi:MAG: hypothetical protein AAB425_11795, partial [Bdellovibrionota bacterium]